MMPCQLQMRPVDIGSTQPFMTIPSVSKWLLLLWVSSARIGWSSESGSKLQIRVSKAWGRLIAPMFYSSETSFDLGR